MSEVLSVKPGSLTLSTSSGVNMLDLAWLIIALPLIGFLISAFAGKKIGRPASGYLATVWVFASFAVSVIVCVPTERLLVLKDVPVPN